MAQTADGGILAGIRVLDLADEKGLPCTKFFADLGADVIKVERPGGDPARARPPYAHDEAHPERSLYFLHWNANKRGITLDLATPDGQDLFRQLARTADVVIETFSPGTLEGWGLDYSALAQINPGLVMTSITVFGQTGPYRDYKGNELIAFALGGLMALAGDPGGPPVVAPGDLASGMASMHAALATQVALFHRLKSGRGQHVDAAVSEAAAHIGGYVVPYYSYHGEQPVRVSHFHRSFELHDVYPTKDGYARLFILPRAHWLTFLDWLGKPPELDDPVFEDQNMRRENSDLINPYVEALCQQYDKQDLYLEAQARHLAITPMNTPADFVESEQTQARGYFLEAEHPVVGKYRQVGPLHKYSAMPPRVRRPAPLVGEHNAEILGGELGLSSDDLASLRAAGVI
ncbi:MAG TPA: CoA transferase [Chloroflexota bacterium]|jgi:crotonobetainyl-CoA:carnitine CoA-transferase CaiB-like acyl-CoA transferase